ncbi:DUF4191 domain-containing protein [Corynebacterium yudongzhengii]|uniref:DUF4191 domain-containing protein n=1 Tax=Corynebacterium yudongzhengii TaxID=2080740 RepID=A0A2U1T7D6_9CORY|nr:DUF4191 domain-containing protein [Corynebacterium yudongzhengii]AWB81527.1 DUF4191 domain-containing protein [Corynebacterium yudongzhengii]PWC01902.1 DUF4191 domain-containing protein [Corynebacterium yudongzhengii]
MAKDSKAADKAVKKAARQAKREKRGQTWKQMWQAFNILRKQDKKLIPLMLITLIGTMLVFFLIGLLWGGQWWMLVLGIPVGILLAVLVFTKRLEASMYDRMSGEKGAGGWALENLRNTVGVAWITKTGVAGTKQMDLVHRVVGNPGVVLVGEGNRNRLRPLMTQQARRIDKVLAGVPIHEVFIGEDEEKGEVPLKKLQRHMLKFPRNYRKNEVYSLSAKLEAIEVRGDAQTQGLPKGPMPRQAQNVSGMNRRMRRASQRSKKR